MSRLASIQSGLDRVRRLRTAVRIGSAASVFISVLLWLLLIAFALDVWTNMSRVERFVLLLFIVPTLVWVFRRWLLPALRVYEDDVQLALVVERNQGISSDLVAAMQFEDAKRRQYGSNELREAVIDYTSEAAFDLDFLEGFSRQRLAYRSIFASAMLFFCLGIAATYPGHVGAFFNRVLLGSARYPTDTIITDVAVTSPGAEQPTYGRAVVFTVTIDPQSVHPEFGEVRLRSLETNIPATLELTPTGQNEHVYVATLDRALDDMQYTIRLGDDGTEQRVITLLMPPVVSVDMQIETPDYAAKRFEQQTAGRRGRSALEGSRVVPVVTADKPLKSAKITLGELTYPMTRRGDAFVLDSPQSPLREATETLRYAIQVTDEDGLSLENPLTGVIQVKKDQAPRIGAAAVTHHVLPTATPSVQFEAVDDYALGRVIMYTQVLRGSGTDGAATSSEDGYAAETEQPVDEEADNGEAREIPQVLTELNGRVDRLKDRVRLNLAPLNLVKGDRVVVTLEAEDYRGSVEGETGRTQPIVFQVTDAEGVRAAMDELDEQMQQKVDEIIKAQLGTGGRP